MMTPDQARILADEIEDLASLLMRKANGIRRSVRDAATLPSLDIDAVEDQLTKALLQEAQNTHEAYSTIVPRRWMP